MRTAFALTVDVVLRLYCKARRAIDNAFGFIDDVEVLPVVVLHCSPCLPVDTVIYEGGCVQEL